MKKIFILFTIMCGLMFASCNNKPTPKVTTFNVEVSDVTESSAFVEVTPSDTTVLYYFDIMDAEYVDEYESDSALAQDYIDWILESVEEYQEYGYDVELVDWLSMGTDSYNFTGLTGDKEYVVLAFAVDTANCVMAGNLTKAPFRTLPVEEVELMFEAAMSDTAIWFLPNNDEVEYFATYMDADTLQAYGVTAAEYFEYLVTYYGEYIEYFTMHGPIYVELSELNPGATYVFAAQAYNGGVWNSPLFTANFTAPGGEAAAPARVKKANIVKGTFMNRFRTGKALKSMHIKH